MFARLSSTLAAVDHLGNPFHVLRKRVFGKPSDLMTMVDRATGVRCECTVDSHQMFSATWYKHLNDVPGLPIGPGDVVIDIGANQGFFTCYAAQKGARVYAFEPVPELYQRLLRNVERNGFSGQVVAVQAAVSDSEDEVEMVVSDSLGGGQSTIVPEFARHFQTSMGDAIRVRCTTLPQILEDYGIARVRVCKIDAEGAELKIVGALGPGTVARIQGFALEYHAEAYPLPTLMKTMLQWRSHQVSLMDDRPFTGNQIYVVSNDVLASLPGTIIPPEPARTHGRQGAPAQPPKPSYAPAPDGNLLTSAAATPGSGHEQWTAGHEKMTGMGTHESPLVSADVPKVDVVIPVYNERGNALDLTVQAWLKQDPPVSEIYVIDDGSQVPVTLSAAIKSHGNVRLIHLVENVGKSGARNAGIALSKAPLIVNANCDVLPAPDWTATCARYLAAHPNVGACYTRIVPQFPKRLFSRWRMRFQEGRYGEAAIEVPFAPGHAVLMRREAVEAVNGYDVRYRRDEEDWDICRRMQLKGWASHYIPESRTVSIQNDCVEVLANTSLYRDGWHGPENGGFLYVLWRQTKWLGIRSGRNAVKGRFYFWPADLAVWAGSLRIAARKLWAARKLRTQPAPVLSSSPPSSVSPHAHPAPVSGSQAQTPANLPRSAEGTSGQVS
jgi:FkbM family methyltransferase